MILWNDEKKLMKLTCLSSSDVVSSCLPRPRYFGTTSVQTNGSVQSYLVLEDVGMTNPAVCDVKLGFASWWLQHHVI